MPQTKIGWRSGTAPILTQLFAVYNADDNTNDSFGSNNGTAIGGLTYNTGKSGNSFVFNETNSYVRLPNNSLNFTGDFSYSFWVYTNISFRVQFLFSNYSVGNTYGYGYYCYIDNGKMTLTFINGGTHESSYEIPYTWSQNWHHVVITRKNATSTKVYINGSLIPGIFRFGDVTKNPSYGANQICNFGAVNNQTVNLLNGKMDAINIWQREIAQSEVNELYNSGNGKQYPFTNDSDAQAFINAAAITDATQQSAINTLVTSLKSAGIWTKMKALYPFVGGTATSHKFNLKDPRDLDAAYRLVFNGGWVHSSTGAKPNGTTGYANTFLKSVDAGLSTSSVHLSFYGRTKNTVQGGEVGCYDDWGYRGPLIYSYGSDGASGYYTNWVYRTISDYQNNVTKGATPTATQPIGLLLGSNTSNVYKDLYINNVRVNANYSAENTQVNNGDIYIGALNYLSIPNTPIGSFTNTQLALVTIGFGLSSTEATAFYNAVQAFQTTLGRQV